MRESDKPQPTITWGILIGGCLGLLESVTSTWMWHLFGQPQFGYRGYDNDLEHVTIITIVGGAIAGFFFGLVITEMAERKKAKLSILQLYLSIMVLGILTYSSFYWMSYQFRWPACLGADCFLFISGIILARRYIRNGTQHGAAIDSAARRD